MNAWGGRKIVIWVTGSRNMLTSPPGWRDVLMMITFLGTLLNHFTGICRCGKNLKLTLISLTFIMSFLQCVDNQPWCRDVRLTKLIFFTLIQWFLFPLSLNRAVQCSSIFDPELLDCSVVVVVVVGEERESIIGSISKDLWLFWGFIAATFGDNCVSPG